jgi:PST family polysaccharide transporter
MKRRWTHFLPPFLRRRVEGREQVQNVLGNITWLSFDKILRLGVGLFVGVWVARYLGPELFGQLSFALAFVALFSPLASLGLDAIVVREIVRSPEDTAVTMGTCFELRLAGSIVALIAASLTILLLRPTEQLMLLLVLIAGAAFLFQTFDVIDLWFQARVQAKYVVYAKNAAFLTVSAAKVGLILSGAGLLAFAWMVLAETALSAAGLILVYAQRHQSIFDWKPEWRRAKNLLQESWPLLLAGVSVVLYMRVDQVMIGSLLNDAEVGKYSVAVKLVEIWYFVPSAIAASVFPALIKARHEDEEFYRRRLQLFYDFMSAIAFGIALIAFIFADQIIRLLYGRTFVDAAPILAIYAWATIPVFLGVASGQHLVVENRTRVALYRTAIGGVVNVLLNLVLIPKFGTIGAAFASLCSYTIATFVVVFFKGLQRDALMMAMSLNPVRWFRYSRKQQRS